jgi:hypothetical protein
MFDPSVIADIGNSGPDITGSIAKGFQLKDLADNEQLDQLRLTSARRDQSDQDTLRKIISGSDLSTDKGVAEASEKLTRAGLPDAAMKVRTQAQQISSGQLELENQRLQFHAQTQAYLDDEVGRVVAQLQPLADAKKPDGTPRYDRKTIDAHAVAAVTQAAADIQNDDSLSPQAKQMLMGAIHKFTSGPITYDSLTAAYQATQQGRAQLRAQLEQRHLVAQTDEEESATRKNNVEADAAKRNATDQQSLDRDAQAIANYQMAPPTANSRSPQSMRLMARVMELNPSYDANQFRSRGSADRAFASGPTANAVRSLGVASSHLDVLSDLATALGNSDARVLNRAKNAYEKQTGDPAPADFNAARQIVGDEVVKAVVGSGAGSDSDRQNLQASFDAANSPAQLAGVISTARRLMQGQLQGWKRQYKAATGRDDFDKFTSSTPPAGNSTGNDPLGIR